MSVSFIWADKTGHNRSWCPFCQHSGFKETSSAVKPAKLDQI